MAKMRPPKPRTQELQVKTPERHLDPGLRSGSITLVVPEGTPPVEAYVKIPPIHCPACRRVRLDSLCAAVSVVRSGDAIASFRCRACGHRWRLPVKASEQ